MRWRKGFTMVELAIVIVIITIMASVAIPRWIAAMATQRMDTASKQVATTLRFARQAAVTTRQSVSVVANADSSGLLVVDASGNELRRFGLPSGVRIQTSTGNPTFHARGTCVGATLTVSDQSRSVQVVVNVVGRIRIQST